MDSLTDISYFFFATSSQLSASHQWQIFQTPSETRYLRTQFPRVYYQPGSNLDSLRRDLRRADLVSRAGGKRAIENLIDILYVRIERDPELSLVFPHFQTHAIKSFFLRALGGSRLHMGTSALSPFHRGTIVELGWQDSAGRFQRKKRLAAN
jgi:hypothetical protein